MADGAAWSACDFGPGLSDLLKGVKNVLGFAGFSGHSGQCESAKAGAREHRGPWESGFGRKGPGHWGGGFVGAREEGVELRRKFPRRFAHLDIRIRAVGVPGHVAMPEVDVPARELPHALEAVRIVAPMLARERHVSSIDRYAFFR